MILKSVIAGLVSMATAAGVVWFGTAPQEANADAHPHKTTKSKTEAGKAIDSATSRITVSTDARKDRDGRTGLSASASRAMSPNSPPPEDTGERRWIDKYIKRDAEIDPATIKARDDNPTRMQDGDRKLRDAMSDHHRDSDKKAIVKRRIIKDDGETRETRIELKADDMSDVDVEILLDKLTSDMVLPSDRGETTLEELMKDERNVEVVVIDRDAMSGKSRSNTDALDLPFPAPNKGLRVYEKADPVRLLDATDKIEDDDLKDQALYAIASYALRFDDFDSADDAMSRIEQGDLKDTARSRIAIRYAEIGKLDRALKEIDAIDSEDLRDVIRVQMIETLTTPVERRGELPGY